MLEHFGKSDWSELETDVVNGVFRPPIVGKQIVSQSPASRRPPRNAELRNAVIPADLFRYDPATRTYKSTLGRLLREHAFNMLITLRDEGTIFEFERTARRGLDWLSLHYRSLEPVGLRMVIVNNDFAYRPDPDDEAGIRIVRDGIYFVARFRYTKANRELVERSGFEFSPAVKWWFTLDPEVAAKLEAMIANPEEHRARSDATTAARSPAAPEDRRRVRTVHKRRQAPAWIKRRRHVANRRQLSLNLGDARKPIIRTFK